MKLTAKIESDKPGRRFVSRQSDHLIAALVRDDRIRLEVTLNDKGVWQFEITDLATGNVVLRHTGQNLKESL